jgi:hypothetical protein
MEHENELQIHSDISAALETTLDLSDIEVKKAPDVVFIGKYNYKKFLVAASINLCFTHMFMFAWSIAYLNQPMTFRLYFDNYTKIGNGYDIAATIVLVLSLLLLSISRRIARSPFKYTLVILVNICVGYLTAFLIVVGQKLRFHWADYLPIWYAIVYCGSFGLFVNALIGTKLFYPSKGIVISVVTFCLIDIWVVYYWKHVSPKLWEQFLYVIAAILSSCYYNYTAHTMLRRRFDYYINRDWAHGYAHLQTYFLVYLWYDWLVLKKGKPRDFNVDTENHVPNESEIELDS